MASNSEYEQRRCFEEIKWVSAKDMLPNPKTYKITGNKKTNVKWFIIDESGPFPDLSILNEIKNQ